MEKELALTIGKTLGVDANKITIKERFLGGMSNYTYHVIYDKKDYVARIIGSNGNKFVNRVHELDHLHQVETLGITSKTVAFDLNTGFKLGTYIEGTVLSKDMKEHDLEKVATVLHSLHASNIKGHDYDLINRLNKYESYVKEAMTETYFTLKKAWIELYQSTYQFAPKVFCHGDAQRSNIVMTADKAYLLDWEFSGLNDPYFDIASFGNIDFNDSLLLLEAYLQTKPTREQFNKVRFYRMYQVLQWHTVATYKHQVGLSQSLHIPFDVFADKYLALAEFLYTAMKE